MEVKKEGSDYYFRIDGEWVKNPNPRLVWISDYNLKKTSHHMPSRGEGMDVVNYHDAKLTFEYLELKRHQSRKIVSYMKSITPNQIYKKHKKYKKHKLITYH